MSEEIQQIKALILGPKTIYREGIRYILTQDNRFSLIGEVDDDTGIPGVMEHDTPDIIIINSVNTDPSAINMSAVSFSYPDIKVILIMDDQSSENILTAIKSGVKACLSSYTDQRLLQAAIEQVYRNKLPVSQYLLMQDVAAGILSEYKTSDSKAEAGETDTGLLQVEEAVLDSISNGLLPEDIYGSLKISEEEFAESLDNIVRKIGEIELRKHRSESEPVSDYREYDPEHPGDEERPPLVESEGNIESTDSNLNLPETDKPYGEQEPGSQEPAQYTVSAGEISKIVRLAREAEKLAAFQEINNEIKNLVEALNDEIDQRHRGLRRVRKAIEEELQFRENLKDTWDRFNNRKKNDKQ